MHDNINFMPGRFNPITARSVTPYSPDQGSPQTEKTFSGTEPVAKHDVIALSADPQIAQIESELRNLFGSFVIKIESPPPSKPCEAKILFRTDNNFMNNFSPPPAEQVEINPNYFLFSYPAPNIPNPTFTYPSGGDPVPSIHEQICLHIDGYGAFTPQPDRLVVFNFQTIAKIINDARKGREHSKAELERIAESFSRINQEFADKLRAFVPAEID